MNKNDEARQGLVAMEYCFSQYFKDNLAPIIKSEQRRQQENAERETRERRGSMTVLDAASPYACYEVRKTSGEWNNKTVDDLIKACRDKIANDPKIKKDMRKLAESWRDSLIKHVGVQKYKELSGRVGCDFAEWYVKERFQRLMMEHFARQRAPKGTLEYIARQGFKDSLIGDWLISPVVDFASGKTATDKELDDMALKLYDPSAAEKTAALATGFAIDGVATMGIGSEVSAASKGAAAAASAASKFAKARKAGTAALYGMAFGANLLNDPDKFDEAVGEMIFDDGDAMADIRKDAHRVKPQDSAAVTDVNSKLANKMNVRSYQPRLDKSSSAEICSKLRSEIPADNGIGLKQYIAEMMADGHGRKITVQNHDIPAWMEKSDEKTLYANATYFASIAYEMKVSGVKAVKVGKENMTAEQVAQKAYDYSSALEARQGRKYICNNLREGTSQEDGEGLKSAIADLMADGHGRKITVQDRSAPAWMDKQDDKSLYLNATYFASVAYQMKVAGIKNTHVGKESMTAEQVAQKAYDYSNALAARQKEQKTEEKEDVQLTPDDNERTRSTAGGGDAKAEPTTAWHSLLDQFGLGGLGETGTNLGYVIASLPDILIGMFTGQSTNLKFGDNLLPIGSIIAGMFAPNPMLKTLLIGLGGATLLNKAGHEALDNRSGQAVQPVRNYKQYPDEPLNPRIESPVIKGNSLMARIDNVWSCAYIPDEAVDAYEKGHLPLNTLSNAVLKKYDEQKHAAQQNYDQEAINEDVTVARSRGIV